MNGLSLRLTDDRRAFRPGEAISGRVEWDVEQAPTSAEVRLFWYTSGKVTQDVGIV
jgi:hypothetical protein